MIAREVSPVSIFKMLGFATDEGADDEPHPETETVRRIVGELDQLPRERARFVAAFAYVLSRAAHADLDISDEETRMMERIIVEHGQLPEEQALIVVQMAKTQSLLFGGTENYLVTREFARIATREQKLALLECLFAVSAADETVTTIEDNVIKQVAGELQLERSDVVAARGRFREYLGVLKDRPRGSGTD
jgi:uncharacterized tellurite resistance protein B-like protein